MGRHMLEFVWNNPEYEKNKFKRGFVGFRDEYIDGLENSDKTRQNKKRQKLADPAKIFLKTVGCSIAFKQLPQGGGSFTYQQRRDRELSADQVYDGVSGDSENPNPNHPQESGISVAQPMNVIDTIATDNNPNPNLKASDSIKSLESKNVFTRVYADSLKFGTRQMGETYQPMNMDRQFRGATCILKKMEFLFSKEFHGIHKIIVDLSDVLGADGAITMADDGLGHGSSNLANQNKLTVLFDGIKKKETVFYDCGIGSFSDTRFYLGIADVEYSPRHGCASYGMTPGCDVQFDLGTKFPAANTDINRAGQSDWLGAGSGEPGTQAGTTGNLVADRGEMGLSSTARTGTQFIGQPYGHLLNVVVTLEVGL